MGGKGWEEAEVGTKNLDLGGQSLILAGLLYKDQLEHPHLVRGYPAISWVRGSVDPYNSAP